MKDTPGKPAPVSGSTLDERVKNARAALDMAPAVATLLAQELGRDQNWQSRQIEDFNRIAQHYLPT